MSLVRIKRQRGEVVPTRIGAFRQVLVGNACQRPRKKITDIDFSQFCAIGTGLELFPASTCNKAGDKKGSVQMSSQSKFHQTLVAAFAAVLMSSVAVGAAVGPAQAVASPVGVTLHA
jgi:hypothetical protein